MIYNKINNKTMSVCEVETGDVIVFENSLQEVSGLYMVSFDKADEKYFLMNLKGIKGSTSKKYDSIYEMLIAKKKFYVLKSDDIKLTFSEKDMFELELTPF